MVGKSFLQTLRLLGRKSDLTALALGAAGWQQIAVRMGVEGPNTRGSCKWIEGKKDNVMSKKEPFWATFLLVQYYSTFLFISRDRIGCRIVTKQAQKVRFRFKLQCNLTRIEDRNENKYRPISCSEYVTKPRRPARPTDKKCTILRNLNNVP